MFHSFLLLRKLYFFKCKTHFQFHSKSFIPSLQIMASTLLMMDHNLRTKQSRQTKPTSDKNTSFKVPDQGDEAGGSNEDCLLTSSFDASKNH